MHQTPEDTGDTASLTARADVKHMLVTHVGPMLTGGGHATTVRAASAFGGPTTCARENESHRID